MKLRVTSLLAASLALISLGVHAHDPRLHAEDTPQPAKAKPMTCAQLADTQRYSNDVSDPDIQSLRAQCNAAKAVEEKTPDRKTK